MKFHTAVISHKRPENVPIITATIGHDPHFYVNNGEEDAYIKAGAKHVSECGTNICQARNEAYNDAIAMDMPCVQVSDDLKIIRRIDKERKLHIISFTEAVEFLLAEIMRMKYYYGGVAVTSNPLNYDGRDFSYQKLVVNDLIIMMPGCGEFDEDLALKEDYDMSLRQILNNGGLVRANNLLCDFPHRQNIGGANTYRNDATESIPTKKLMAKWPYLVIPHRTRPGQVSLNYKEIDRRLNSNNLFNNL